MDWRHIRFAETAPEIELREHRPWLFTQVVIVAVLGGLLLGVVFSAIWGRGQLASYRFDLWRWEAQHIPGMLMRIGGVHPGYDGRSEEEVLRRYFGLTTEIRDETNRFEPDRALLQSLFDERAKYEKLTARIISEYIDDAVAAAGLREQLPFFRDVSITWPPVQFELVEPPNLLVRSPRDRIERRGNRLLQGDLSLDDIDWIEATMDDDEWVSLVVQIGGMASYPAIIRADRNYWGVVETAAHEWIHHYLAFYPLGQQWLKGGDAYVLNETVANIAGRALAHIIHERNPMSFPDGLDGSWMAREERTVDFNTEMRQLRLRVDDLLEEGRIEEAERLMEETRLYLADNGIVIRRINQAYFAFYGTYADTPASTDPIGPKVEEVWQRSGEDLRLFLVWMRDVKTVGDLDALLVRLGAGDLVEELAR
jgi:hypothetical protein